MEITPLTCLLATLALPFLVSLLWTGGPRSEPEPLRWARTGRSVSAYSELAAAAVAARLARAQRERDRLVEALTSLAVEGDELAA